MPRFGRSMRRLAVYPAATVVRDRTRRCRVRRPDRAARKLAIAENAVRYAFTAVEAADKPVKIEVEITQERAITSLIRTRVGRHDVSGRSARCTSSRGRWARLLRPWRYRHTARWLSFEASAVVPTTCALDRRRRARFCRQRRLARDRDRGSTTVQLTTAGDHLSATGSAISAMSAPPKTTIFGYLPTGASACPLDATFSRRPGGVRDRARQRCGLPC